MIKVIVEEVSQKFVVVVDMEIKINGVWEEF